MTTPSGAMAPASRAGEADALVGAAVGGYTLTRVLGEGGMARVYHGVHADSGQAVAVKMLLPALAKDRSLRERFVREGQAMARLEHPAIPRVFGLMDEGPAGSGPLLFMELIDGETLEDVLGREGRLAPLEALDVAIAAADALAVAHARKVVHRDLKPANLMRRTGGGILVMDFGTAKVLDAEQLTQANMTLGTVHYMSPEQLMAKSDLGPAADVYALGVTLFELLTGSLPFDDDNLQKVMGRIVREPAPAPSARAPGIPSAIDRVLACALAKRPDERFPAGDAFAAALRIVRAEIEAAARPAPAPGALEVVGQPGEQTRPPGGAESAETARDRLVNTRPRPAPPGTLSRTQALALVAAGSGLAIAGIAVLGGLLAAGAPIAGAVAGSALMVAGAGVLAAGLVAKKPSTFPTPPNSVGPAVGALAIDVVAGTGCGVHRALGTAPLTIGRAPDNDLVLADPSVSGRHARIDQYQGGFYLVDVGSSNGTYLNGAPVGEAQLRAGDTVSIGGSVLRVRAAAASG